TNPPLLTSCPSHKTLTATSSWQALIPDLTGEVAASDNCTFAVTQSPAAGTMVAAGTTTPVNINVTDASGNTSTCIVQVAVRDKDCDGIEDSIDRNQSTGADESQIF